MYAEYSSTNFKPITQLSDMRQYSGVIFVNESPVVGPAFIPANDEQTGRYSMDITQWGLYAPTSSKGSRSFPNFIEVDLKNIYNNPLVELRIDVRQCSVLNNVEGSPITYTSPSIVNKTDIVNT